MMEEKYLTWKIRIQIGTFLHLGTVLFYTAAWLHA